MCIFFFQAEDGIRDIGVTGVQTCALPISSYAPDVPTAAIDLAGDLLESFAQQSTAGFIPAAATVMAIGVVLVVASFFVSALWAILRGVLPGSGGNSRRR